MIVRKQAYGKQRGGRRQGVDALYVPCSSSERTRAQAETESTRGKTMRVRIEGERAAPNVTSSADGGGMLKNIWSVGKNIFVYGLRSPSPQASGGNKGSCVNRSSSFIFRLHLCSTGGCPSVVSRLIATSSRPTADITRVRPRLTTCNRVDIETQRLTALGTQSTSQT